MALIIELVLKVTGYSLIIYGLWLMFGDSIYSNYVRMGIRKYQAKRRIKRLYEIEKEKNKKNSKKSKSAIYGHLEFLLASVSKKHEVNVVNFIVLSLILLTVSFTLLNILIESTIFTILISMFICIMPYLILIYRLESLRQKTSYAFLNEFHIILQSYQSTEKNIYYTLLNAVDDIEDKYLKKQFRKLIASFQKERHDSNFIKHVHLFVYSINSTFAKRFGNLLIKAHIDNANIGLSLSNLNDDISQRKRDMEDEKTRKLETVMLGFSPIVTVPLVLYFAYQVTGVLDFWKYFMQSSSLNFFIITIICSVFSILIAMLIRKPRADI